MNAKLILASLATGLVIAGLGVAEARNGLSIGCGAASVHRTAAHSASAQTGTQLAQANAPTPRGSPSQRGSPTSRQNSPVPRGTPRQ
jgi:hypothetical protein